MLSPVQCDQLKKKKIIPKIEGIDFHLSGPDLPGCPNPQKGEAMGHTESEGSQNGLFLSQQALVSSSHPRGHPHFILIFPGKALCPSGLSRCSGPPAVPAAASVPLPPSAGPVCAAAVIH